MQSCTATLSVLLFLVTECKSATPTVKVKLHGSAFLPCTGRCSGVISWTQLEFSKRSDPLAECDQTSCRSVKEGYQMIYNQYLQGDFSLIITEADFSKRGTYTADCDGTDLCDVLLQIESLKTTVQKRPGESLLLNLHISDPVEVIYNSTDPAGPSSHQICRVEKRSVQLSREYSERTSVSSDLELRGLNKSDSGVYTVRDILNDEIIHIYTVIVHGDSEAGGQEQKSDCQGAALPDWVLPVLVWLVVVCVVSVVVIWVQWRKNQRLQNKVARNGDLQNNSAPLTEVGNKGAEEQEKFLA
ncbi:hypothetical protein AMEX_G25157 [Astyanax mexicanus]|uniref:Immunoglobulin domain-containing protein n=1 Tax=Astyanax mexicanus TaxID=7994 RepID=A0A8T2KR25_ASTMX|nr:hypothetical protein AMEX_G25157 [Astyanax mexicanus]